MTDFRRGPAGRGERYASKARMPGMLRAAAARAHLDEAGAPARSTPCMTSAKKSRRGLPAGGAACTRARTGEKRGACLQYASFCGQAGAGEQCEDGLLQQGGALRRLSWLQVDVPSISLLTTSCGPMIDILHGMSSRQAMTYFEIPTQGQGRA